LCQYKILPQRWGLALWGRHMRDNFLAYFNGVFTAGICDLDRKFQWFSFFREWKFNHDFCPFAFFGRDPHFATQ
jgi:hypothetical protein